MMAVDHASACVAVAATTLTALSAVGDQPLCGSKMWW
jgi:hypothetical protein